MSRFNFIDLSKLPAPKIVDEPSFEEIFEQAKSELIALDNAAEEPLNVGAILVLESEPLTKLLQAYAYRELTMRQRINEAVKAGMLAFARTSDLDQLAANMSVERKTLDAGDADAVPPILATFESDDNLRFRTQLAPEAMTAAGSSGSYIFNAMSAGEKPSNVNVTSPDPGTITVTYTFDPDGFASKVKSASVISPNPGQVTVTVLGHDGDGVPDAITLDSVTNHLTHQFTRPLTDQVTIQAASILNYSVTATLYLYEGPDGEVIRQEAEAKFWAFVAERHNLGEQVTQSGIDAALHQTGVQKVVLDGWADITATMEQAAYCTVLNLSVEAV